MVEPVSVAATSMQVALLGTLVEGARRWNVPAVVNAAVVLVAAALPTAAEFALATTDSGAILFQPELTLWIATAGFLHSLGMLGLYETVWWWDHLTHTVSAMLVAALLYAAILYGTATTGFALSRSVVAAATVGLTFSLGVLWELIELVAREVADRYHVEPVLVHYGWRDTAYDLVFDLVGAVLVVALDARLFVPALEQGAAIVSGLTG